MIAGARALLWSGIQEYVGLKNMEPVAYVEEQGRFRALTALVIVRPALPTTVQLKDFID